MEFHSVQIFLFCLKFQIYAYSAREHEKKYGTTKEHSAKIAYKNHFHSQYNPNASLQKVLPMEAIKAREIVYPLTLAMCALTADGGAAAVVCNKDFMIKHKLQVPFSSSFTQPINSHFL